MIVEDATGWEVEAADFGGKIARHRHGDVTAVAYVYSEADRVWAECTVCGADLQLELTGLAGGDAP